MAVYYTDIESFLYDDLLRNENVHVYLMAAYFEKISYIFSIHNGCVENK